MTIEEIAAGKIPQLLVGRPRYKGLIVPFTVAKIGKRYDFKAVDPIARDWCLRHRSCGVCGYLMSGLVAFIGGELAMETHAFTDVPMHRDCARYATLTCPFLLGQKGYAEHLSAGTERMKNVTVLESPRTAIAMTQTYTWDEFSIQAGAWVGEIEWYARGDVPWHQRREEAS